MKLPEFIPKGYWGLFQVRADAALKSDDDWCSIHVTVWGRTAGHAMEAGAKIIRVLDPPPQELWCGWNVKALSTFGDPWYGHQKEL